MKHYTFNRSIHKWVGIIFSIALLNISVTGLLLLEKKSFDRIQPKTETGSLGTLGDIITNQALFAAVFAEKHQDFQSIEDIDRVDFRPGKRVFKVHSKHHYSEIQIDAITGDILKIATRNSDRIEAWHDGSAFGTFIYKIFMPALSIATILLVITGLYLWLAPMLKRRKNKET